MTFLRISELSKKFNAQEVALSNFNFDLSKGKVMALVGESGSGKSTLLRIIAGFEFQDKGEVFLGDLKFQNAKEKLIPGNDNIQLVHQGFLLFPNSTVEENISRPLLSYDQKYRKSRVKLILKFLGLTQYKDKFPRQLSGGQQQKVAIGRALSSEPEVLLLDEPFSNLDTIQKRELIEELKTIFREVEVTVLFVTHDLDDALQLSDELLVIQNGKLIQQGTPDEIFRNPVNSYTAKLFSHLNPISDKQNEFVRPADITILKSKGIAATVLEKQYLVHHNLLTVRIKKTGDIWKIEDPERKFSVGDAVYLKYKEEHVLVF